MDDVFSDEPFRDAKPFRKNPVKAEKLLGKVADGISDIDPLFTFVKVNIAQSVRLDHRELLVFTFPQVRVDDYRPVMACMHPLGAETVPFHRTDDSIELPGGGRAAGIKEMPADVYFKRRIVRGVYEPPVLSEIHYTMRIFKNR
jgi:hypothetical protein